MKSRGRGRELEKTQRVDQWPTGLCPVAIRGLKRAPGPATGPLIINPRRACVARVTLVGSVCVCVSVTPHLTSRVFVRLTNDTTYPTGNEGQNFCAVFSENAPLQS